MFDSPAIIQGKFKQDFLILIKVIALSNLTIVPIALCMELSIIDGIYWSTMPPTVLIGISYLIQKARRLIE